MTAVVGEPPVLPCYLALDTSDSMVGPGLDAAGSQLARLWDAVAGDRRLSVACRLAVVTFDAEARLHLPLTEVAASRAPRLAATRPATDFEALFTLLRRTIALDVDELRGHGWRPLRPVVVLLSDGRPTRGAWPMAHAALTDPSWPDAPAVLAFGVGDPAEHVVRRIGTAGAYLPSPGAEGRGAPAGMIATLVSFLLEALGGALTDPPAETVRELAAGWRPVGAATGGGGPGVGLRRGEQA